MHSLGLGSTTLHFDTFWVSIVVSIYCKEKFSERAVKNTLTYTYIHAMTMNDKRSYKFERDEGGYMQGLDKGEERKICCNYIIISKMF